MAIYNSLLDDKEENCAKGHMRYEGGKNMEKVLQEEKQWYQKSGEGEGTGTPQKVNLSHVL